MTDSMTFEPIVVRGDDVHDASIELDNGYWRCKLCRRQATGMAQPRGHGILHAHDCFLVTAGIIEDRNRRQSRKRESVWWPPSDIDAECVRLCAAINAIPGVRTVESCCGHGRDPFRVWLVADSLDALPPLLWCFDGCHSGHYGWRVIATTDCAMSPVVFRAEGPIGAFSEADDIAALIESEVARVAP